MAADQASLQQGQMAAQAGLRGRFGWAMFDWANQPYFTVVTTFIFAPYFTAQVIGDSIAGQSMWGYIQTASGLLIAVLSPMLGAIADRTGARKPWILFFQLLCVLGCFGLWFATPGLGGDIWLIFAFLVVASVGAEFAIVFNNAMLPMIVRPDFIGRWSGFAWGLGYVGGLIALVFVLVAFALPAEPWFGLDKASHQHNRIAGPLSAVWLMIFVVPMFLFTPDVAATGIAKAQAVREGLAELRQTLAQLGRYRNIARFLLARMLYQDGLNAIFAFSGIYAAGLFGWEITELGIFGIILASVAAIGALAGGFLDDRLGSKPTVLIGVCGLVLGIFGLVSITIGAASDGLRQDSVLFFLPLSVPAEADGMFASTTEQVFLAFGILVGLCGGPTQAASRTLMARLAPPEKIGAFFGLYALSGKATAFLAPLAIAFTTQAFVSQRAGLLVILVFLAVGLLLLLPVQEPGRAKT